MVNSNVKRSTKRWKAQKVDPNLSESLQQELKIHPIFCNLLVSRGITTYAEAKSFFRPSLDHLHDPFLMKDMGQAIKRIKEAIENNEKLLIYGDYDVDGTTSVALVYSFFKTLHSNIDFYIPDRYKEGYGVSKDGIDYANKNKASLIIALDCGIKAIEQIEYANQKGIDFIICDHHRPGDQLPNAIAVLDPKREDCQYPYKELSGCGIGFKLIEAYAQASDLSFEEVIQYLDFVTISIACDIVPITGENRVLAFYGLQQLSNKTRPGIHQLLDLAGFKKEHISIDDLVFKVGPRINAAGRMGDAKDAVRLLISEKVEASNNASNLNASNTDRQKVDQDITQEAMDIIANDNMLQEKKTTVLFQPHWHKGVIGIVASRLIETYYRPTIVLTESEGKITGSARSVVGFDIYNAIKSCEDLLEQFGGHKYAAGLTLSSNNLNAFIEKFEAIVSNTIDKKLLTPEITVDANLSFTDINYPFFNLLQQFAPFGPQNMKPVFRTTQVVDSGYSKIVGERHLKLSIKHQGSQTINGIAFGMANYIDVVKKGNFDVCYTLEENEWQGNKSIQLNVKDIHLR